MGVATNVFASRYTARQVEQALERAMSAVQSINGQQAGVGGDVFLEALKLQKGDPASVEETVVAYAASPSGRDVPPGPWSETVPPVPQGEYLWTQVTVVFNSGEPVVFYTVSRMGMDGHGSVAAVNGFSPDSGGNVTLTASQVGARPGTWLPTAQEVGARPDTWLPTAAEVGALPVSGGSLTGALSVPEPSQPEHAATKAYVDEALRRSSTRLTLTLPADRWSALAQTVSGLPVTAEVAVLVCPEPGDDGNYRAYLDSGVRCVSQGAGTLSFRCDSAPSVDLTVNVNITA